jgi:hypothetical protein
MPVIPAKAGIPLLFCAMKEKLDTRIRGNDEKGEYVSI